MFNRKLVKELKEMIRDQDRKISRLYDEKYVLVRENEALRHELEGIKPILENPEYELPKSQACQDCVYAVFNRWNHDVVGCRKNALCDDFKPMEDGK